MLVIKPLMRSVLYNEILAGSTISSSNTPKKVTAAVDMAHCNGFKQLLASVCLLITMCVCSVPV